jgi:hypothetical protein
MEVATAMQCDHSPDGGIQWFLASSEAWDVLPWVMHPTLYDRRIRMASKLSPFVIVILLFSIPIAK